MIPDAATDLLLDMENSNYRFQASSALVKNLTGDDSAKAMNWATELPEDEPHIKTTVIGVRSHTKWLARIQNGVQSGPHSLDEGDSRKRIVSTVINYWSVRTAGYRRLPENFRGKITITTLSNKW